MEDFEKFDLNKKTETVATDNTLPPQTAEYFFRKQLIISEGEDITDEEWEDVVKESTCQAVLKAMQEYAQQSILQEREKVIQECIDCVNNLIRSNCSDHTPYRGACVSCGRVDNFDVLPDPDEVIKDLEDLKALKK